MNIITVENLQKKFLVPKPVQGNCYAKIKNYIRPVYQTITAVDNLSFNIAPGERVAFIGPNGAGKSTTIKILTGIMQPSDGTVTVLNKTPWLDRKALAYKIGAVFGQRSQLWYHLPVQETFLLLAAIYDIPPLAYQQRLNELAEKFVITGLLAKPVRQLSLGERMRCEVVASFLHRPQVLFLDEPTIGLDIVAKSIIRNLICEESKQAGITLLLTSHDTDDIEKVCDRVIIIDKGSLVLDDSLTNLKTTYIKKRVLTFATLEEFPSIGNINAVVLERDPYHLKIEVDLANHTIEEVVTYILANYTVKDLSIEGPPLETIIHNLYQHA